MLKQGAWNHERKIPNIPILGVLPMFAGMDSIDTPYPAFEESTRAVGLHIGSSSCYSPD
jgi:hypothetical protein